MEEGSNIYDEQGSARGSAEISVAHPTLYEDLEEVEMEDRETEDGGGQTFMMNRAAPEALLKFHIN